jgi:glycosyltransferase involved in cell wall biosynthesis
VKNKLFNDAVNSYKSKDDLTLKSALNKLSELKFNSKDKILFDYLNSSVINKEDLIPVESSVCGRYFLYPETESKRFYEGGRRKQNIKKYDLPNEPLVTIITVVYNNVKTVEDAVKSVLSQTYKNIEYIVVDGGSKDGTVDVLTKYEKDIDYLLSEQDGGIYNAMNKAISLASGSYICFLNADDYYLSYAIDYSIKNITENGLDLSYGSFYYADERGQVIVADEGRPWDDSMLIQGIPGGHETIVASKKVYELNGGFNEKFKVVADYDWVMRAFKKGFKAKALNKVILVMNTGGASFEGGNEYKENIELLRNNFGDLDDDFCDFLYNLKYYKNWYDFPVHDHDISRRFCQAVNKSELLFSSIYKTVSNRKIGCLGTIKPKEKTNPSKLKIAVCLSFINNVSGGAERIAIEQANKLVDEGHSVTLVACHGEAGEPYYSLNPLIPIIDLAVHPYNNQYFLPGSDFLVSEAEHGGRVFDELNYVPSTSDYDNWNNSHQTWRCRVFRGFFKANKFDVTISHMPSTYTYTLLAGEADDSINIAVLHNSPTFKFYSDLYHAENKMERYMRLVALEKADKIGVLFEEFINQVPVVYREKCFVLPNFTSVTLAEHTSTAKNNSKTIISVGRLVEQKDQKTLIEAFSKLRSIHDDWSLKIYGDGPLKEDLVDCCIKNGLAPEVVIQGVNKDLEAIYTSGDIFVLPSLFEGFGLTLVEAMKFGLPVVAFDDCEGAKNLINNNQDGVLVNAQGGGRVDALCLGLQELVSSEEKRSRLGAAAIIKSAKYTIEDNFASLNSVINPYGKSSVQTSVSNGSALNVAILSTYLEGGAGIAANRLKYALIDKGVNAISVSFSPDRKVDFHMELPLEQQRIYDKCQILNSKENLLAGSTYFSSSYPSLSFDQLHFLKEFDVINLHWTQNMLSIESIAYIHSLGKPVVWTLHDMNPFTGGCHYTAGCKEYMFSCNSCPQMIGRFKSYPNSIHSMKVDLLSEHINVVSPSRWLAKCAKESSIFSRNPVHVIPNSIDIQVFTPTGKLHARGFFGLPLDKKILLFTCHSHGEKRKGFDYLIELAKILSNDAEDYHILTFGNSTPELDSLPIKSTSLGHISEEWKLALGYSAADMTILPSLEDNLPNVILESLACGTPVVAFDNGGIGDVVIDNVTGLLCDSTDVKSMSECVKRVNKEEYFDRCRNFAIRYFEHSIQAESYVSLFESLIKERNNISVDYFHIEKSSLEQINLVETILN